MSSYTTVGERWPRFQKNTSFLYRGIYSASFNHHNLGNRSHGIRSATVKEHDGVVHYVDVKCECGFEQHVHTDQLNSFVNYDPSFIAGFRAVEYLEETKFQQKLREKVAMPSSNHVPHDQAVLAMRYFRRILHPRCAEHKMEKPPFVRRRYRDGMILVRCHECGEVEHVDPKVFKEHCEVLSRSRSMHRGIVYHEKLLKDCARRDISPGRPSSIGQLYQARNDDGAPTTVLGFGELKVGESMTLIAERNVLGGLSWVKLDYAELELRMMTKMLEDQKCCGQGLKYLQDFTGQCSVCDALHTYDPVRCRFTKISDANTDTGRVRCDAEKEFRLYRTFPRDENRGLLITTKKEIKEEDIQSGFGAGVYKIQTYDTSSGRPLFVRSKTITIDESQSTKQYKNPLQDEYGNIEGFWTVSQLQTYLLGPGLSPEIECADGFKVSVQASRAHCCTPRNNAGPWTTVECHAPSSGIVAEWRDYFDGFVYCGVPIELVVKVLNQHRFTKCPMRFESRPIPQRAAVRAEVRRNRAKGWEQTADGKPVSRLQNVPSYSPRLQIHCQGEED